MNEIKWYEVFGEILTNDKFLVIVSVTILGLVAMWKIPMDAASIIGNIITGMFGIAVGVGIGVGIGKKITK